MSRPLHPKPPLGAIPRNIWLLDRMRTLAEALSRQLGDQGYEPNIKLIKEWCSEIHEHANYVEDNGQGNRGQDNPSFNSDN